MFNRSKPEVVVVGAGPVGLFSALSLAARGIQIEILEEEWRGTQRSYALALHPRSLELLDELGLASKVLEISRPLESISVYDLQGHLADVSLSAIDSKFPILAILPQGQLENLLVEALKKEGVEIKWDNRLARVETSTDFADITVDQLTKESVGYSVAQSASVIEHSRDLRPAFVLSADGHGSLTRRQLGIRFDSVRPADRFAVFEFDADGDLPEGMCLVFHDQGADVLWPMPNNRYRWSFQLPAGDSADDRREKDRLLMQGGSEQYPELDEKYLDELIDRRAPWFRGNISHIQWRTVVGFEQRLASAFGRGRVWLAGDAAHTTGPVGAQSMNVGLVEAAELAQVFASMLRGNLNADALVAYNHNHLSDWQRLLGVNGHHLQAKSDATDWQRHAADRLRSCLPASGPHLVQLAARFGLEWAS